MADVVATDRRIVVAVDDGEESMHALRWCLRNLVPPSTNGGGGDTLILLYARPPPPVHSLMDGIGYLFSDEVMVYMDKYSRDLAGSIMERAESICKDHNNNKNVMVKVEAMVKGGDARDLICEMVEKLGADMLVMGSHDYGFVGRALLGSVSDYCAHNARCPVVTVKCQKD